MAGSGPRASGADSAEDTAALWGPPPASQPAGQLTSTIPTPPPSPLPNPDASSTASPDMTSLAAPLPTAIGQTTPARVLETLDGQGQVWEVDLGAPPVSPAQAAEPDPDERSSWAVDLDQADGWVDEGGKAVSSSPRSRKMFLIAAAALALVLAGLSIPGLLRGDDPKEPTPDTVVLGGHLSAPVALNLPEGAIATADDTYVGVQFPSGGRVLVTVPEQVVQPDGLRAPMPSDPATWLRQHPDVFVSGVRQVTVDGRTATQVDYRRSAMAEPQSRYARLSLFCGWRGSDFDDTSVYTAGRSSSRRECTQITDDARVRATFIPVGSRTVLVEAVWRPYGVWGWRMPNELRNSYDQLLQGLSPRTVK